MAAPLVVMISGGGRTMGAIHAAIERGELAARIALVIASRECPGAERARALGLPTIVEPGEIPMGRFEELAWPVLGVKGEKQNDVDREGRSEWASMGGVGGTGGGGGRSGWRVNWGEKGSAEESRGAKRGCGGVVLAGYLRKVPIPAWLRWRIVNVHPALLPAFGGAGMFGMRVHAAVLEAGCKVTGCTVHLCDEEYDRGPILVQRSCEVMEGETPAMLAARVFEEEKIAYVEALRRLIGGGGVGGGGVWVERSVHGFRATLRPE